MQNSFVRLEPRVDNRVFEMVDNLLDHVLCVECGWETVTDRPVQEFAMHQCRLVSQMVSKGD